MGAVYSGEMDRIRDTRSPWQILVCGKKVPGGGIKGLGLILPQSSDDLVKAHNPTFASKRQFSPWKLWAKNPPNQTES